MLGSKFFANNRKKLQDKLPADALVILIANGYMQRTSDTVYPFRQDSNFYYLTGIKEPDIIVAFTKDQALAVLPQRSHAEELFSDPFNRDDIAKISGIGEIHVQKNGWDAIKKMQHGRKKIYTVTAPPVKVTHTDSFFTNGNRRRLQQKLTRIFDSELIDIRHELTLLRQIKEHEEVDAIKQAIAITAQGLQACHGLIKAGKNGRMITATLDKVFRENGCEHAFSPVVMSGADTCVIHSLKAERVFERNDLVLVDVGAEYSLYSADVSRTYTTGKRFNPRHQAVYDAVALVKTEAARRMKPGLSWRDWITGIEELMGEQLIELGLIKKNTRRNVRQFFPHALGHGLGLDTHDTTDYFGNLEENMIIALEPGIYIPEEGIGIRIEDDMLVTKQGVENLSGHIAYE